MVLRDVALFTFISRHGFIWLGFRNIDDINFSTFLGLIVSLRT